MEIPPGVHAIASLPKDSPYWRSIEGEEYFFIVDKQWLIANKRIGPHRVRIIAKVIKEMSID